MSNLIVCQTKLINNLTVILIHFNYLKSFFYQIVIVHTCDTNINL